MIGWVMTGAGLEPWAESFRVTMENERYVLETASWCPRIERLPATKVPLTPAQIQELGLPVSDQVRAFAAAASYEARGLHAVGTFIEDLNGEEYFKAVTDLAEWPPTRLLFRGRTTRRPRRGTRNSIPVFVKEVVTEPLGLAAYSEGLRRLPFGERKRSYRRWLRLAKLLRGKDRMNIAMWGHPSVDWDSFFAGLTDMAVELRALLQDRTGADRLPSRTKPKRGIRPSNKIVIDQLRVFLAEAIDGGRERLPSRQEFADHINAELKLTGRARISRQFLSGKLKDSVNEVYSRMGPLLVVDRERRNPRRDDIRVSGPPLECQ